VGGMSVNVKEADTLKRSCASLLRSCHVVSCVSSLGFGGLGSGIIRSSQGAAHVILFSAQHAKSPSWEILSRNAWIRMSP
jgi:hypothetical protein